jgi:hypothetical protein
MEEARPVSWPDVQAEAAFPFDFGGGGVFDSE